MSSKGPLSSNAPERPPIISSTLSGVDQDTFLVWCKQTSDLLESDPEKSTFVNYLDSIPVSEASPLLSLACLAFLVNFNPEKEPAFQLLLRYTKLLFSLPESIKAGHDKSSALFLQELSRQVTGHLDIPSLFSSSSEAPALLDPTNNRTISHKDLSSFISSFSLPLRLSKSNVKPVISLALPNGYLSGIVCLAVASYYTAAPLNIAGGAAQFQSDASLANPDCILVLESDVEKLALDQPWVSEANIQIVLIHLEQDMTFSTRPLGKGIKKLQIRVPPNSFDDLALLLFTSGTSGTKKVVPTTVLGLLLGVTWVIESWGLTHHDTCVNMMPLNHVGGIVRNLFAPVLSGGSTILCPAFDPNLFWDTVEEGKGTWYYASPSMHMSILAEGGLRSNATAASRIRLVCNAAGSLLPALAIKLRDTFNCTVLPSYGMTECMPISTPPLSYILDRPGTSGVGCGPEIAILNDDEKLLPAGEIGRINVRGGSTFPGYLKDGKIDKSAFNSSGWFDTGDLGMLDKDGFLFLTGRGKEVINRGGEIISPFEVEEAITVASQDVESPLYHRVQQALAFSAPDETLQEVVGVALVCPSNHPVPDLRVLHAALKLSLHSSKWPMAVVYMAALPTSNNKLMRIKFAERMGLVPFTSDTTMIQRHFNATNPPVNSPLTVKITNSACKLDFSVVQKLIRSHSNPDLAVHLGTNQHDGTIVVHLAPISGIRGFPFWKETVDALREVIPKHVPGYLVPSNIIYLPEPFPTSTTGTVDVGALDEKIKALMNKNSIPAASETEMHIRQAFSDILGFAVEEISSSSDFFEVGGDSMSAGRLLSTLRRDLGVRIPVDQIFTHSRVCDLCDIVDQILEADSNNAHGAAEPQVGCTETYSSSNPLVLFINLLPIFLFYPMKLGFQWTVFMYSLSEIASVWSETDLARRFIALVTAMAISRVATQIVAPCVAIILKWIIIGKFKEGMYPMWGPYHIRWWLVERIVQLYGKGVFRHFDSTRIWYLRLLGARIGRGVVIEKGTVIGEYDLVDIEDNVHLDRCICRPFAAERNTSMFLGKIKIGRNSSIGLKTHIAAGSTLPEYSFIGANSSSYEVDDAQHFSEIPPRKPHLFMNLFVIFPLQILVLFASSLPWMSGLVGMVSNEPLSSQHGVYTIINWWATPQRIGYHYFAQAVHVVVRPFVWFICILCVKKALDFFCGTAKSKSAGDMTQKDYFRKHILTALIPHGSLKAVTKLFGSHYEFTSFAVRSMGGKIGKRVYWPGTGPTIEDFDLVEIGDDVVFGSRSHLVTSNSTGSRPIKIGRGAMVADRVVINPGAIVGEKVVLGSGTFITSDQYCEPNSVWVGNRGGSAICLSTSSSSPNGSPEVGTSIRAAVQEDEKVLTYDNEKFDFDVSIGSTNPSTPSKHTISNSDSDCEDAKRSHSINLSISSIRTASNFGSYNLDEKHSNKNEFEVEVGEVHSIKSEAESNGDISTPFGRAFYENKATYWVFGQTTIFLYSTFITVFVQVYWNATTISTLIIAYIIQRMPLIGDNWIRPVQVYGMVVVLLSGLIFLLSLLSLFIVVIAKWIIIGRRKVGSYDWDKSSYCQRWQLFLAIEAIRRKAYGGHDVLGMLTGTHFLVLYFRALGAKIGKDCALFAGGRPSLMFTEPDMITLGDRVTIDDASVVGHINSRGNFSLNELSIGDRSVLRSGSRLLSGAKMGDDAVLLEHTLIMAGDLADNRTVYQGWPANTFRGNRLNVVVKP